WLLARMLPGSSIAGRTLAGALGAGLMLGVIVLLNPQLLRGGLTKLDPAYAALRSGYIAEGAPIVSSETAEVFGLVAAIEFALPFLALPLLALPVIGVALRRDHARRIGWLALVAIAAVILLWARDRL